MKNWIVICAVTVFATIFQSADIKSDNKAKTENQPADIVLASFPVKVTGADDSTARIVSSHSFMFLIKYQGKVKVVKRARLEEAMKQSELKSVYPCTDPECFSQMGKLLGANRILVPSLDKVGGKYIAKAALYDTKTGESLFTLYEECRCTKDKLPALMKRLSKRVMANLNGKMIEPTPHKRLGLLADFSPQLRGRLEKPPKADEIEFTPATADERNLCPKDMVYIPAGWFSMGCNSRIDKKCMADEYPYHMVDLDAYCVDRYKYPNKKGAKPKTIGDWDEARLSCEAQGKRLLSEAEWEKAARGTDGRTYPWGEGIDKRKARYQLRFGGGAELSGLRGANKSVYGVYDMAGNLWEWVSDWYDENYYYNSPDANPQGPMTGDHKVLRGGSWFDTPDRLRTSMRGSVLRGTILYADSITGFRCAMSP